MAESSFLPFDLERWQSTWENRVRFNLSESGVHPLSIRELLELSGGDLRAFAELRMVYSQSNGTETLRQAIAAMYPGTAIDQITVTVGSAEANFVVCWALVTPGDRVAVLTPTYMQTWGLSQNLGAEVVPIPLEMNRNWDVDPGVLDRAITKGTKLVVITNPNNPTGRILPDATRQAIVERARDAGAWLLCDEVYTGAERNGITTPSFWGSYDRTLVVNGLSKAYGLPGLRIGWIVAPHAFTTALLERHDYTVIGPSPMSDHLAIQALSARPKILARTRGILNANYPILTEWLSQFGGLFSWRETEAGAICYVRLNATIRALDLVERVRAEQDILLVPGEHFGMPGYLRLGYGNEQKELKDALRTLHPAFASLISD